MKMKAQAAMEYLMTYGWAILIVIIVAAALYALGVFNPATWTGTRSTGFANIGQPTDWMMNSSGIFNITLKNSLGQSITINQVTADCGSGSSDVYLSTNAGSPTIGSGSSIEYYNDTCATMTQGSSFSFTISVTYTKGGGVYSQTDSGTVTGQAV